LANERARAWKTKIVEPGNFTVVQGDELATTGDQDRIIKSSMPAFVGHLAYAAARSSLSAPRATIFNTLSGRR
jgi:hypothetical protein